MQRFKERIALLPYRLVNRDINANSTKVWVFVMCGCFSNMRTCSYCVFLLFVVCLLYCFVYVYLFLFVLSVLVSYDSVRREVIYKILIEFGIPRKLVRLIKLNLTETYSRVRVGKNVSDKFPIRNGLKQGDAVSPMLFTFALEYAIRRVQVNQDGLKLNGTHQILAYANDVNILGGSIHNLKENAEVLVAATRD